MNIKIEKGLIWTIDGRIFSCLIADEIARANGEVYAESFVKKYDGKTLTIDWQTLKIKNDQIS